MTATNFNLSPNAVFRAFSTTGQPLAGGSLYTYAAGTLTPLATYTDSTGGTPNTNPVVLDSTGSANVWMSRAAYKFVLKDANGVTQWTVDQINAQPVKVVDVADYGAVGDGSTDDSTAFTNAAAAAGSWGTVLVKRPTVSYLLNSNITGPCFWALMGGATTSGAGTLGGLTIQQVSGGALNIGNFYINSAGDIGVGTNAPIEQIDIAGNVNFPYVGGNPSGKIVWNGSGSGNGDATIDYNVTTSDTWSFLTGSASATFVFGSISSGVELNGGDGRVSVSSYGGSYKSQLYGAGLYLGSYSSTNSVTGVYMQSPATAQTNHLQSLEPSSTKYIDIETIPSNAFTSGTVLQWVTHSSNSAQILTLSGNGGYQFGAFGSSNTSGYSAQISVWGNTSLNEGSTKGCLLLLDEQQSTSSSLTAVKFTRNSAGSVVGSITTTNAATAFNTSSDYRLKENLQPIFRPLSLVEMTKMYNGNFKVDPNNKIDFALAHEVQELFPYAVTGVKDGEQMQQVDYSKLVPVLWAAVQELSAKVKELQNER